MGLHREVEAFDRRLRRRSLTVLFSELTDSDSSQSFDFAAALPAGAFVVGGYLDVTVAFIDAGVGTFTADLGIKTTDPNAIIDGADLTTAIVKTSVPAGVSPLAFFGSGTPQLTIDGSVNVDTATAGAVTAYVYYFNTAEFSNS